MSEKNSDYLYDLDTPDGLSSFSTAVREAGSFGDWVKAQQKRGAPVLADEFLKRAHLLAICEHRGQILFLVKHDDRHGAEPDYLAAFEDMIYTLFNESWKVVAYVGCPVFHYTQEQGMQWMLMPSQKFEYRYHSSVSH